LADQTLIVARLNGVEDMKRKKNITIPASDSYDVEGERKKLRDAAEKLGISIPENFYSKIESGNVIQIYTSPPEYKQLYCNDRFYELCSYSNEQLASIPWTKLFWRSDDVNLQLMKRAEDIVFNQKEAVSWGLDPHELVESLHPRKRTFEIEMLYAAPFYDKKTGERRGIISTQKVNFIFEWPEEII
jgi:hypothetical protein